jgi:hypothetical protein
VKASIVLDRATGAILKTSGEMSALSTSKSRSASTAASFSNEAPIAEESESKGLEDFAAMIWNYVKSTGNMVQELDTDVRFNLCPQTITTDLWLMTSRMNSSSCGCEPRSKKSSLFRTQNTYSPSFMIHLQSEAVSLLRNLTGRTSDCTHRASSFAE